MAGYNDFLQLAQGQPQPQLPVAQVVNPVSETTGMNTTPPKDEADLAARQQGWNGFFEQLRNDPTMRNTALMAGAQLLQGPSFMGENTSSIFGRALQAGVLTHQMGRAGEAKAREADIENKRANALAGSQMEANQTGIAEKKQRMKHAEETLPLTKRQKELQLQQEEFNTQSQPRLLDDKLATGKAQRNLLSARAEKARSGGVGGTGMEKQTATSELSRLYEIANPEATPQEIATMVLGHNKKAEKTGGTDTAKLNTLRTLFENAQDDSERTMYQDLIHQSLGLATKGEEKAAPAVKFKDPDGYRKKWHSVKEGEVFTYEGKQYKKETPK